MSKQVNDTKSLIDYINYLIEYDKLVLENARNGRIEGLADYYEGKLSTLNILLEHVENTSYNI